MLQPKTTSQLKHKHTTPTTVLTSHSHMTTLLIWEFSWRLDQETDALSASVFQPVIKQNYIQNLWNSTGFIDLGSKNAQSPPLVKTTVKYLDLMPQIESLITECYIQWVQSLKDSKNWREHMVFHSTQETTAAPSCPNSCQTFKLYSYIPSVLFAGLGCFGWLVVGLGFPLLKSIKNLFSIMTMSLL